MVELAGRAIGAVVIGFSALLGLGLALAVIGGGFGAGFVPVVAELVLGSGSGSETVTAGFVGGAILLLLVWALGIRRAIRRNRRRLVRDTESIDPERDDRVAVSARRIAAQFDRPVPELRRHPAATPLAYTTTRDDDPVLVVSNGLLETLSDAELEAVIAHELAHVANGDLRVMTWVLVPLVATEGFTEPTTKDWEDPFDRFWGELGRLLVASSLLAVGLFSRGREFAADRAAAAVTGDPAALAAAIERLDSATERPSTDLRERTRTVDALAVHPTLDPERDGGGGLFATHPATERRLERLRRLADD